MALMACTAPDEALDSRRRRFVVEGLKVAFDTVAGVADLKWFPSLEPVSIGCCVPYIGPTAITPERGRGIDPDHGDSFPGYCPELSLREAPGGISCPDCGLSRRSRPERRYVAIDIVPIAARSKRGSPSSARRRIPMDGPGSAIPSSSRRPITTIPGSTVSCSGRSASRESGAHGYRGNPLRGFRVRIRSPGTFRGAGPRYCHR